MCSLCQDRYKLKLQRRFGLLFGIGRARHQTWNTDSCEVVLAAMRVAQQWFRCNSRYLLGRIYYLGDSMCCRKRNWCSIAGRREEIPLSCRRRCRIRALCWMRHQKGRGRDVGRLTCETHHSQKPTGSDHHWQENLETLLIGWACRYCYQMAKSSAIAAPARSPKSRRESRGIGGECLYDLSWSLNFKVF